MGELNFKDFQAAVQKQFDTMKDKPLFVVDVDKYELWDTYLDSFPEGTNEVFRERREYDCQCCKQFIRTCGSIVSIVDNKLVSIWDISIGGAYQVVADAVSAFIKSKPIKDTFLYFYKNAGLDCSHAAIDGEVITFNHFFLKLPESLVRANSDIPGVKSEVRENKEMFVRSMNEITLEAADMVLELISQKSLYRGVEHKATVKTFIKHKKKFDKVCDDDRDNYCWEAAFNLGYVSRIKNTVIGTLLVDISSGVELDDAVRMFESKVAPENYKRPTAIVTKGMIDNAQKKVEELGIEKSLHRRYATVDDVTINNVLFANRDAKKAMNVFDEMKSEASVDVKKFNKVDEIVIDNFLSEVLPNVDSVELMLENRHINNLISLIAPVDKNAPNILKWDNNFSWAYNGEVADSIREAVKKAGGVVDGVLNFRLAWNDGDGKDNSDLDAWAQEPTGGKKIGYNVGYRKDSGNLRTPMSGQLDVDNTQPGGKLAVENITWINKAKMKDGVYKLWVNQYSARNSQGFKAEIEFDGNIYSYSYNRPVVRNVHVAEVTLKNGDFTISHKLNEAHSTKTVWGINTQQFHKVSMIMNSPNHWDGNQTGNKHMFFVLDNCNNPDNARGFFNEFLKDELTEHRKVFEVLGSKLKAEHSDNQLSGLGFSSTKKDSVLCKLTGSFSRTIKIIF